MTALFAWLTLIPTGWWVLLVIVCVFLATVVPAWQALAIYCVGHLSLTWLAYRALCIRTGIRVVQEITGLEFERAKVVHSATLTGDWSKVATEELRLPVLPDKTLAFQEGSVAKLKCKIITMIIIERNSRLVAEESRQMMDETWDRAIKNTDPEMLKELRKKRLL